MSPEFVAAVVYGFLLGFFMLLCLRQNKNLLSFFKTNIVGTGGCIFLFFFLLRTLQSEQGESFWRKQEIYLLSVILCSMVISFASFTYMTVISFNKRSNFRISIWDFFINTQDSIKDYVKGFSVTSNADLDAISKDLARRETSLQENMEIYKQQKVEFDAIQTEFCRSNTYPYINLPVDSTLVVSQSFLDGLNDNMQYYTRYLCGLEEVSHSKKIEDNPLDWLLMMLRHICCYSPSTLFADVRDVRIHMRVLINEKFRAYMAYHSGQEYTNEITPMSLDNKMINGSFKNGRPLIKSLNMDFHETAHNDATWVDYMTFTLSQPGLDGYPFMSFGMAIRNNDQLMRNKNTLYFLALARYDLAIEYYIAKSGNILQLIRSSKRYKSIQKRK